MKATHKSDLQAAEKTPPGAEDPYQSTHVNLRSPTGH